MHKLVYSWLKELKLINSNSRILDIGCRNGGFAIKIKEEFRCEVYALDIPREESPVWVKNRKAWY